MHREFSVSVSVWGDFPDPPARRNELSRGAHCPGWNNYQLLNRNYRRRAWFEAAAGGIGPGKRTDGDPAPRRRVRKYVHRKRQVLFYRHGGSFRMQKRGKFDTGVDAGRNDAALMIAEPGRPGRSRLRLLAARGLAAVLLVAFAALLALPSQAQAQTVTTLVDNSGESRISSSSALPFRLRASERAPTPAATRSPRFSYLWRGQLRQVPPRLSRSGKTAAANRAIWWPPSRTRRP